MRAIQEPWIVLNLEQFREQINPNPTYQRPPGRWTLSKEQLLIDSMLRGYDIPKIYLAQTTDPKFDWEIVDGQQRIRAIWRFLQGDFALPDDSEEFEQWGDLSTKKYNDLPTEVQKAFGMFKLSIVVLEDTSTSELEDLFRRLQQGVRITPVEYRNALSGEIRDFVIKLSEHRVFRNTKFKSKGWKWRDLVDHVLCIELAGNPTDIKAKNLQVMYELRSFPRDKAGVKRKVKRVFDYMERVLSHQSTFMDIKWGFVDLYILISSLIDRYDLSGLTESFADFYYEFEGERRLAQKKDPKLLVGGSYKDRRMFDYCLC